MFCYDIHVDFILRNVAIGQTAKSNLLSRFVHVAAFQFLTIANIYAYLAGSNHQTSETDKGHAFKDQPSAEHLTLRPRGLAS